MLGDICASCLKPLNYVESKIFYGPRRIAVSAVVGPETQTKTLEERGPRETAPEAALNGFLGKHGAKREEVAIEAGYYILRRAVASVPAAAFILKELPEALAKFSWPKSMRWGQGGDFTWVRPLRRVVCLLDGQELASHHTVMPANAGIHDFASNTIPIQLGPITASNETEGHRTLAPGAFPVSSCAGWQEKLRAHYVIADPEERREKILRGITEQAAIHGLTVVKDDALIDEVTGLVEWPVPLIGKIDKHFMDLPPEVRELSMKVNQRYFALRDAEGNPAPYFAFIANLEAPDNGAAIIAGNERVLRARLSDARHFWEQDLKTPLDVLLPKLDHITFHAKIGSQGERVKRIATLAAEIAETLGADKDQVEQARWAGLYCKADLVTGMVAEFPELQGVIGGYYAEKAGGTGKRIADAIKTHYQPKGPGDMVPNGTVAVSVALADKLDTLTEFFRINEKPTGSGDPYALRRAALGVIRIILENDLRLALRPLVGGQTDLFEFIIERVRVKLRNEGKRFDVLDAVWAAGADDDLVRIMKRVDALMTMLATDDGQNLLSAYKRAANILRIETARDGSVVESEDHNVDPRANLIMEPCERELLTELTFRFRTFDDDIKAERFGFLMSSLAGLRPFIDRFFQSVTVNAQQPEVRLNRLRLLSQFVNAVHQVADFSKIEG